MSAPDARPTGPRVRVFVATSVDCFIAGEGDDLSWLPAPDPSVTAPEDYGFGALMAEVGALLMGRGTYDVVAGFPGDWPYGERPVLVATHRPLSPKTPSVRAVSGAIGTLLDQALAAAGGRDVYLDGGALVRQALDDGRVDEITVTVVPIVLGRGTPLLAGASRRHPLALTRSRTWPGGMVQLTYEPRRPRA